METPVRSSSRNSGRQPPNILPPSMNGTPIVKSSASTYFPRTPRDINGSSSNSMFQTPQRSLRKPMSMQTLSSVKSMSKMNSSRLSTVGEVYKGNIHVGVRARPENGRSVMPENGSLWSLYPMENSLEHASGVFTFDKVYDGTAYNEDVFQESVQPLIDQVVEGYNATVFAYGTTGSGKTYTMQGSRNDPGVIPRSVEMLFDKLDGNADVRLSYFEIYNEKVYDLITQEGKPVEVTIRDGNNGEPSVVGNREVRAESAEELLEWIACGDSIRRTSSTQYNEHSSRSHAVVRIHVTTNSNESVLYLCDLAGSERYVGDNERRKEGAYINKSLLTLSTIISILSQGGGAHVPFRDSKLTRLLQPSLSGTALVSVVCTIQTGQVPTGSTETLNTVRFAAKAKNITVTVKRNNIADEMALGAAGSKWLEHLQHENESLKRENHKLKTEKEDLQDKVEVLESAGGADAEESLEALAGISFNSDADDTMDRPTKSMTTGERKLKMEITKLKSENNLLHDRISQLVYEIEDLNDNIKSATASEPVKLSENEILRSRLREAENQIEDLKLALKCSDYADAETSRVDRLTELTSSSPNTSGLGLNGALKSPNCSTSYPDDELHNLHIN